MKEKFKVGDSVIYTGTKDSRHFGEEGTVIAQYASIYEDKKRWKVKWNDPRITPIFICCEDDLDHTVEYKRDKKLKDLGI